MIQKPKITVEVSISELYKDIKYSTQFLYTLLSSVSRITIHYVHYKCPPKVIRTELSPKQLFSSWRWSNETSETGCDMLSPVFIFKRQILCLYHTINYINVKPCGWNKLIWVNAFVNKAISLHFQLHEQWRI